MAVILAPMLLRYVLAFGPDGGGKPRLTLSDHPR